MSNPNQADGFKDQIKSHYESQQLSARQIRSLQSIDNSNYKLKVGGYVATASCMLAGVGLYFFYSQAADFRNISKEIAYNHNIKLQMEVLSPNFATVQERLNKLGFTLVSSNKIPTQEWKIVGGRYCNINGKIAAQMRVIHNDSNAEFTFYQAKVSQDLIEQLTENEISIDGVKIKLWREKGLLMGLAF